MAQLQKNYAQQLSLTREKASQLKSEINNLDKSTPDGQKKFIKLSRDLQDAELKAGYLEKDIKTLDTSISSGKFSAKLKVDDSEVPSKVNSFKNSISSIREVTVGALREIGALAVNKLSDALGDWVSGAVDTQNAMIALKNTMNFSGNVKEYDSLSKRMQKLATDTNANTEDTLKLATTFIGLGNNSETAGQKVENLVKANQAFGGSTENLKGVTQAYQQMSAAGKVSAENINQLTDNNTALGSALKTTVMEMNPQLKQFGSFAQASEKGKISVEMLDKAMQKLGQAGGGGVATIENSMASLNETISLAILPALTAITPPLTDFIDSIASGVPKAIEWFTQLWESFQASNVFTFWNEAVDNFKKIVSEISTEVSNLLTSFGYIPNSTSYSGSAIDSITVIFESLMKTLKKCNKRCT
ncbi:tape measure protein [Lactococcus fujiensis]|uniref:tape measure protein n=1 Tax=Lactococcus fujiensis TaxID=610251 RepID=UPI0006D25E93|nr:tape measure protein [Lactococcus fujiensis]